MSSAPIARLLRRCSTNSVSRTASRKTDVGLATGGVTFLCGSAVALLLVANAARDENGSVVSTSRHQWRKGPNLFHLSTTSCDYSDDNNSEHDESPSGYTETERFYQTLEYHRSILPDYYRRWGEVIESDDHLHNNNDTTSVPGASWPRNVPEPSEVSAIELDLAFCQRSPKTRENLKRCQDMQFRIASYYVSQQENPQNQRQGVWLLKELAEHGHPDGMCLYGLVLNEGLVPSVEANPEQAVEWWRRCVDLHRHITAMYELAVALYTGEAIAENTEYAVLLFRRAAHLGHAGAAYMLGECLLDGVGVDRDRGNALEWLVTAAELGHQLARHRVISVLNQDYEGLDPVRAESERKITEASKWEKYSPEEQRRAVKVERRFSIGGAGGKPPIVSRRKTIVAESRERH